MLRREWVEQHLPNNIGPLFPGGVFACPGSYDYSEMPGYDSSLRTGCETCDHNCVACWSKELPTSEPVQDNVNHPAHYELPGGIECFDVLLATQGLEAVKSFCICNAVKYLFRRNRKNGDEDVKKAAWYVAKYIELAKEDKQ